MSCTYADGLSAYDNKGKCGLPELFDDESVVESKVKTLAEMILKSKHLVVHTGAGISTAAGIPDFRGPKGVWTLEEKGEKPNFSLAFNETVPTTTHMVLVALEKAGFVKYLISQNVDGLHLRSGFPRSKLSELHGNMFVEQCNTCQRQFVRNTCVPTVGQKCLEKPCPIPKANRRTCRGKLHDTILDWEAELPYDDLQEADNQSKAGDLHLCLGTTLQIVPSGKLPLASKSTGGKLVICNLQPTKYDRSADLIIHTYVDNMMIELAKMLGISIPEYSSDNDPTQQLKSSDQIVGNVSEWTLKKWLKPPSKTKLKRSEELLKLENQPRNKKLKEEEDNCVVDVI